MPYDRLNLNLTLTLNLKWIVFLIPFVLFYFAAPLSGAESSAGQEPEKQTETVDRVIAVVNDDIIRLQELKEALAPIIEQIRARDFSPAKTRELIEQKRDEVLNSLIQRTLADQVIEREGITVSDAEVDAAIERVKQMNNSTDEELRRSLRMNGMDMKTYRKELRRQILQSKLVNRKVKSNIVITDADIREYYEKHNETASDQKQYHLKNIFMACSAPRDPDRCLKARQKMRQALDELESGRSFESVARKYSEGSNASDGGDLGAFSLDDLQKKLQPVIQNLSPGEASGLVETDQGLQIFYLAEISSPSKQRVAARSEKIRKKLYQEAVDAKFQEWIKELREASHIQIIQ